MKNTKKLLGIIAIITTIIIIGGVVTVCLLNKDKPDTDEPEEKNEQTDKAEAAEPADKTDPPSPSEESEPLPTIIETTCEIPETHLPETTVPETQPPETTAPETHSQVTVPTVSVPYLEKVKNPSEPIYSGPGYNYYYVQTVGEEGTFTIMEESIDHSGNVWGRLKSGLGWINLTHSRSFFPFISSRLVNDYVWGDQFYAHTTSQYHNRIEFKANTDVSFNLFYVHMDEVYGFPPELVTYGQIKAGETFVAQVGFMDTTGYKITVTDNSGNSQTYTYFISGKDGSLSISLK